MSMSVDEALAALAAIEERLASLDRGSSEREQLEARRSGLRREVELASDRAKPRQALLTELEHLERRLAQLDTSAIKPSVSETGRKWITDPGAYSHQINRRIEEVTQHDRVAVQSRIERIRQVLAEEP